MTAPHPYPRVAHLVAGRGTRDDLVLSPGEVTDFLAQPVVVEEKVDGANVVVWMEGSQVTCALRSGPGAMDRAGQLGPLRAWLAQHDEALRTVVPDGVALYAEWLLLTHSVAYDRLPAYLVALDLWRAESGSTDATSVSITTSPIDQTVEALRDSRRSARKASSSSSDSQISATSSSASVTCAAC